MQNKPGITFSAYTYGQLGAEAFTLELGKARPFGENQEVNLERLERSLELLIDGSEEQPDGSRLDGLKLFSVSREVIKHSDHFRLHLDDDVANFTELSPGYLLAEGYRRHALGGGRGRRAHHLPQSTGEERPACRNPGGAGQALRRIGLPSRS